jgi:hypothetical protein
MDFGWRFRRPTDATTFVTPNQMSEHARRRDLIKLRHFLSPRRGLGCAWRAPTHKSQHSSKFINTGVPKDAANRAPFDFQRAEFGGSNVRAQAMGRA